MSGPRLADTRLAIPAARFAMACAASRAWDELAATALAEHGSQGPLVSGCCRSHFPESIKAELRGLARMAGDYCDNAREARPKGVHLATIRELGREVARRDGVGRYGPQAGQGLQSIRFT